MSEDMLVLRKYAKLKNDDHEFIHLYNFSFNDRTNYQIIKRVLPVTRKRRSTMCVQYYNIN